MMNDAVAQRTSRALLVDPTMPAIAYPTVNAAFAAGKLQLPAGQEIVLELAPGVTHTLTSDLTVDVTRNLTIIGMGGIRSLDSEPVMVGNFILPSAVAEPAIRNFKVIGVKWQGNVTGNGKWNIIQRDGKYSGTITRNQVGDSVELELHNIKNYGTISVVDTGDGSIYGDIICIGCELALSLPASSSRWVVVGQNTSKFINCYLELMSPSADGAFIDFSSDEGEMRFVNTQLHMNPMGQICRLARNHENTWVRWWNSEIYDYGSSNSMIDFGGFDSFRGVPKLVSKYSPLSPPVGTVWTNPVTNAVLVWDGTYWRNGHVFTKDVTVAVGASPVSDVDLEWDIPTGAFVVGASINIESAITGAGGAVGVGLGVAADPDKYGKTAALTKNAKGSIVPALAILAGAEDLKIYAIDAGGGAVGTIQNGSVRVFVSFIKGFDLPNA